MLLYQTENSLVQHCSGQLTGILAPEEHSPAYSELPIRTDKHVSADSLAVRQYRFSIRHIYVDHLGIVPYLCSVS